MGERARKESHIGITDVGEFGRYRSVIREQEGKNMTMYYREPAGNPKGGKG